MKIKSYTKPKTFRYSLYTGDYITLGLNSFYQMHNRLVEYSGLIVAQKNTGVNKIILVISLCKGIYIKLYFLIHSPEIIYLKIRYSAYVKRSKVYDFSFLKK
jgi:ribosomal protein L19